jgi:transcriptional regulator with XRE-family HTH domain
MKEFDKQKRNIGMMKELRKQGLTLKEIGEKMGLSKQRIHQLLQDEYFNKSELDFVDRLKGSFEIKDILKRGFPDFLIITKDGKICAVEVKSSKGNKLSSYQKKACLYLNAAGIPTFISMNGELNKDIINFFKEGKGNKDIVKTWEDFEKKSQIKKLDKERGIVIKRAKIIKFLIDKSEFSDDEIASAFKINPFLIKKIIKNPIPLPYNKGTEMEKLYQ